MSIERAGFGPDRPFHNENLPERYQQPGFLSEAGQMDRRREGRHVVRVRDLQREAVEGAAEQARTAFVKIAEAEARRRVLTELKFNVHRAQKESQLLAGEDPELQAKFAVLDDDFFQAERISLHDWND